MNRILYSYVTPNGQITGWTFRRGSWRTNPSVWQFSGGEVMGCVNFELSEDFDTLDEALLALSAPRKMRSMYPFGYGSRELK